MYLPERCRGITEILEGRTAEDEVEAIGRKGHRCGVSEPMESAATSALSSYRVEELAFLIDFLKSLHAAALAALAKLRELA